MARAQARTPLRLDGPVIDGRTDRSSPHEPARKYRARMAEHLHLWIHTDPLTGRRRKTRHRLSEADAQATLRDPVRIESSLLVVEPRPHGKGWSFASGLVTREDGVKMQPESLPRD